MKILLIFLLIILNINITYSQREKTRTIQGIKIVEVLDKKGNVLSQEVYHKNGKLSSTGDFDNHKPVGKWVRYYENGEISEIGNYKKGEKNGVWKWYYRNGNVRTVGTYKNSKQIDAWKRYFENGNIKDISISKGKGNGTIDYKLYYENEIIQMEGCFINGERTNNWKYYYTNGKLKQEMKWLNGKLLEVISYFDSKGNILYKGNLTNGNGTVFYYDDDGKKTNTVTYKQGIRQE